MKMSFWLIFSALLIVNSPLSFGVETAYLSFKEPTGWACELAQKVWICQSTKEKVRKESVILSIAAPATEWDTLENYEKYLKKTRKIKDQDGKIIESKVIYTRKKNINGFWWIDSLQQNSELPGFWARYLSTVHKTPKSKLAILMTYIVSEESYKQLAPQFERMIASLKPNENFNLASQQGNELNIGTEKVGSLSKFLPDLLNVKKKRKPAETKPAPTGFGMETIALFVLLAATIYWVMRRRKKRKQLASKRQEPRPPSRKRTG